MATSGGLSQSLLTSEEGFEQHCDPAKPGGVQKPLMLRRRITQVWESAEPYPKPRALTMWYTFGSICLGSLVVALVKTLNYVSRFFAYQSRHNQHDNNNYNHNCLVS